MARKPEPDEVIAPWVIKTCRCSPINDCEMCDGAGWYFHNTETGDHVSDLIRDACERHG